MLFLWRAGPEKNLSYRQVKEVQERLKKVFNVAVGLCRSNFTPGQAMCGPNFNLRRHMVDESKLLMEGSENF
jgi:hypothetical protein